MSFITDKQTLDDLNLLGKYKPGSVFSLFNQVNTIGGEKLLEDMFRNPLTNADEINRRSCIFKYFQTNTYTFPFSNEQFSAMENYCSGNSGNNYPAALTSLTWKKLLDVVVRDEEYKNIQNGLQQAITLLSNCKIFISQFKENDNPFYDELLAIKNMLNDPKLNWLSKESEISQWPLMKIARYDYLLRYQMRATLKTVLETFYK